MNLERRLQSNSFLFLYWSIFIQWGWNKEGLGRKKKCNNVMDLGYYNII